MILFRGKTARAQEKRLRVRAKEVRATRAQENIIQQNCQKIQELHTQMKVSDSRHGIIIILLLRL